MIKKALFSVFLLSITLAAVFGLGGLAFAQEDEGSSMAILIENAEIKTIAGGIEISAVLFNPSLKTETPLATNLLLLTSTAPLVKSKDIDYNPPSLIVSAQEGEEYFSLKPGERKAVNYSLPISPNLPVANYALDFRLIRKDGYIAGRREEILRDFGFNGEKAGQNGYERGFLAFFQESCVILNIQGEKFEPNEGPVFEPLERPKARCLIKNIGGEDIVVYPKTEWKEFFVYGRPSSGDKSEEKNSANLAFKKGETKLVEISLPSAQKPQVYQALLSFEDIYGDKMSFDMSFRWTIGGSSARVEKVSLAGPIKNIYKKGETLSLSVDYFGSMDLYWRNAGVQPAGLSGIKMLAVVKDKNDEICGQEESVLPDINDSGRKNQIMDVFLDKKCDGASYAVSVSSGGKKLAEEETAIPKTAGNSALKIYYSVAAAILFLALFALIKRKKKIAPIMVLFLALASFGLFSHSASASTKTYSEKGVAYSGTEYGGKNGEDSAPMYSFYGVDNSNNVNQLVITRTESAVAADLSEFSAVINYGAGFTSCSNSTMQIRYEMYIKTDNLSKTSVNFATKGSYNKGPDKVEYKPKQVVEFSSSAYSYGDEKDFFYIDPEALQQFYDANKRKLANPQLIIEIVQSGKSTHGGTSYHRGDFSKPVDTANYSSRSGAFNASDIIRYKIPLNLPDTFPLTIKKEGNGRGEIILKTDLLGNRYIFNCGNGTATTDCGNSAVTTDYFLVGTIVKLNANAFSPATFTGWSDNGCSGAADCFITMNTKKTTTVSFIYPSSSSSSSSSPVGGGNPPSCSDGIQNQNETGVDTGGVCGTGGNPPSCSDGIQNQNETGVDTGGVCGTGGNPPSCSDGIQNQNETGVDTGGVCGTGGCPSGNCSSQPSAITTLTVSKTGTGSGSVSMGSVSCSADSLNAGNCQGTFSENEKVAITVSPDSASTFEGWGNSEDCNGKDKTCSVTMTVSKTVTVNFDRPMFKPADEVRYTGGSGACSDQFSRRTKGTGITGPITVNFAPTPESADPVSGVANTYLVKKDYTAGLRWDTTNAVCCDRSGGGGKDNNWWKAIMDNADERAKTSGWYGTNAFQPTDTEYDRVYGLNCYNDDSIKDKSVIVRNPWWQPPPPPPGISMYADPNPIEYGEKTTVYWSYSNPGGNEGAYAMSPTDYYFRDPAFLKNLSDKNYCWGIWCYLGGGKWYIGEQTCSEALGCRDFLGMGDGYYRGVTPRTTSSYETKPLTASTTYKISGWGGGSEWPTPAMRAEVTVKVLSPAGFKISSSKNNLTATIVDGLSANSDSAILTITNTTDPARSINVTLGASLPSGLSGIPVFSYGGTDYSNSAAISLTAGESKNVNFKVKSIPGSTNSGNYNLTVNSSSGTAQKTAPITLKVEKVTTEWKEF